MLNNLDVRKTLALILVASYVVLIAVLCLVPGAAKGLESDTIKTLLGSLSALVALAGNFYFTSSAGSDKKTDLLAQAQPATPEVKP